jgi:hypothetical protein
MKKKEIIFFRIGHVLLVVDWPSTFSSISLNGERKKEKQKRYETE